MRFTLFPHPGIGHMLCVADGVLGRSPSSSGVGRSPGGHNMFNTSATSGSTAGGGSCGGTSCICRSLHASGSGGWCGVSELSTLRAVNISSIGVVGGVSI